MIMYRKYLKRIFAFLMAIALLICFSPVMILIAIFLFMAGKTTGGVLFIQQRIGYKGKPFNIYKFKTMNDALDKDGNLLSDMRRQTRMGNFLRWTSMDELPQLFNVIKGDMNFVGPRPMIPEHIALCSEGQLRRHLVVPGITGWAQVNGRNSITYQQKFEYDMYYLDNVSLLLDIKILCITVIKVFKKEGVPHLKYHKTECGNQSDSK